jgi:putative ABC transport system permease protein
MPVNWITELVREGIRNLVRHKLRSTLTLLGVVFGVSAVITMLAVGEGGQRSVLKEISGLGLNNIIIDSVESTEANRPKQTTRSSSDFDDHITRYGLTFRDADQVRGIVPGAEMITGHLVKTRVFFGNTRLNAGVLGVPPEYYGILNARLVEGRLPCDLDERLGRRVAVVTAALAGSLKRVGPAVGQKLKIGHNSLEVIGVVGMPSSRQSEYVYMPYRTARDLYGSISFKLDSSQREVTQTEIGQIVFHLPDDTFVQDTAVVIQRILDANHSKKDFAMTVPL